MDEGSSLPFPRLRVIKKFAVQRGRAGAQPRWTWGPSLGIDQRRRAEERKAAALPCLCVSAFLR